MTILILFCMIVFVVCVLYNLFDYEYFQIEPEEKNIHQRIRNNIHQGIGNNTRQEPNLGLGIPNLGQGPRQNQRISVIDYKPSAITMKENIDNKERVDNISQGTGNNAHRETEAEKKQSTNYNFVGLASANAKENIEHVIKILNEFINRPNNNSAMFLNLCKQNLIDYKFAQSPHNPDVYYITIDYKQYIIFNPFLTNQPDPIKKLYLYDLNIHSKIKKITFNKLASAKITSPQTISDYNPGKVDIEYEKTFDQNDQNEVGKIILNIMNETIKNKTTEHDFHHDIIAKVRQYLMQIGLNRNLEPKIQNHQPEIKRLQIDSIEYIYFYPITQNFYNIQHYYWIAQHQLTWPIKAISSISTNLTNLNMGPKKGQIECQDPTSPLIREMQQNVQSDPKNAALKIAKAMFKNEWTDKDTDNWNNQHKNLLLISDFQQNYLRFTTPSKIYLSPKPGTTKTDISPKLFEATSVSNSFEIADVVELAVIANLGQFDTISQMAEFCEIKGKYQYAI